MIAKLTLDYSFQIDNKSNIHYLSEENRSLQEYIQDLESALKLNKQTMYLTLEGLNKRPQLTTDNSTMSTGYNYPNSQLESVIQLLNEENQKTNQRIIQLISNYSIIINQNFISRIDMRGIIRLLQRLDRRFGIKINRIEEKQLERMKPIQERECQFYKMNEIVSSSEQNLRLHEEFFNVRNLLNKITQEAQTLSDTNYVSIIIFQFLKREMFKIRIALRNQINFQTMKNFVYDEYLEDLYGTSCLGYGLVSKEECIEFLMSIYNDYFKIFDLGNVKKQQLINQIQNRKSNKRSIKRSYSYPQLYFSNVNAITFNKPLKLSVIALAKNEIQLLVAEIQKEKQKQIQNQVDGVFSVDFSKIDMKQNKRQMFDNDLSFISNLDDQD
ncbi:unnamed protein product [Paramecium primaurelia]|uniref:Uncharacterized protein n=1 Tax=Paramecium primaurelia TaxID=5886 RepID=A0A8S1QLQ8_PARPR|nr:unnamed protein product [Paramecium primaurelia]